MFNQIFICIISNHYVSLFGNELHAWMILVECVTVVQIFFQLTALAISLIAFHKFIVFKLAEHIIDQVLTDLLNGFCFSLKNFL